MPATGIVKTATDAASLLGLLSGVPMVATNIARLNSIKKLFSCGAGDGVGDEPERMSAPFKLEWGSDNFNFARGTLLGNTFFVGCCILFILVISTSYCLYFGVSFRSANLRLRNPGVLFVVFTMLIPPCAEAATQLVVYGDGWKDMLIGIGFASVLVFFPIIVLAEIARQNAAGRVIMYHVSDTAQKKTIKAEQRKRFLVDEQAQLEGQHAEQQQRHQREDDDENDSNSDSDDEADTNNNNNSNSDSDQEDEEEKIGRREARRKKKASCLYRCQRSKAAKALQWLTLPRFEYIDAVPAMTEEELQALKKHKKREKEREKMKLLNDSVGDNPNPSPDFLDALLSESNHDEEMIEREILHPPVEEEEEEITINLDDDLNITAAAAVDKSGYNSARSLDQQEEQQTSTSTKTETKVIGGRVVTTTVTDSTATLETRAARPRVKGAMKFLERNSWYATWGASGFEDYSLHHFAPMDVVVSALIGISAGVASGVTTVPVCIVCFAVSALAAFTHLFTVVRYLCVTPHFVLGYTIVGDVLTFVSIVLAFIQYLLNLMDEPEVFAALALTNAGLGVCSAVIGIVSEANFL